ncbi:unnamed protein product [Ilex paraguariensis]|uniref:phospholipase A2 n=1 Tax=Ilex paraguariensis TaxID=185542 RepID=A0ABC8SDM6_9AQUA
MASPRALKLVLFLSFSFIALNFCVVPINSLNVGIQANAGLSLVAPPFLRYGKYCGLLYGGCPGEKPCDGLDACCMKHDACIQAKNNEYLSQECSQSFLNCIARFKRSGGQTFKGNTCSVDELVKVMTTVMNAALLAGRVLHKP